MTEMISVEVCYALPEKQVLIRLKLPLGATLLQALEADVYKRQVIHRLD